LSFEFDAMRQEGDRQRRFAADLNELTRICVQRQNDNDQTFEKMRQAWRDLNARISAIETRTEPTPGRHHELIARSSCFVDPEEQAKEIRCRERTR
jgi:hypothetical protein